MTLSSQHATEVCDKQTKVKRKADVQEAVDEALISKSKNTLAE